MDHSLEIDQPKIIFIGGTGRSGTNITKAILANHPEVASLPFEYRFIIDPDGIVDFYRSYSATWSPYLADRRLKRLERLLEILAEESILHRLIGNLLRSVGSRKFLSPRQYHGWNLDKHLPNFKQYSRELLEELRRFSFSAYWVGTESYAHFPQLYHAGPKTKAELACILGKFVCRTIDDFLRSKNKTFFVEDNTWNILFAHELVELIPTAKVLHVYRDPRDVVASLMRQRWAPSEIIPTALWYKDIMAYWFTVRANIPPESYYEFSLEDLVASTESIVKRISKFAGIPYHPALLDTDLGKSHTGRWKKEFTKKEKQVIQDILSDEINSLGYTFD